MMPLMSVPCFPCSGSFPEGLCFGSWAALTVTLSRDRCAWQRLSTTWRGPLPSRPARTRCAASAWRWCMRNPQPRRGGLGSCPTATTRTACPASASGDVPSSSRTPSSSELCDLPWPGPAHRGGWSCKCSQSSAKPAPGAGQAQDLAVGAASTSSRTHWVSFGNSSTVGRVWPVAAQPCLIVWSVGRVDSATAGTL